MTNTSQDRPAARQRDWTIDVVRVFSLGVVVTMHWISTRVWVTDQGVHSELAMHGSVAWALTWILQVMPLFFIAGGFANTMVVDRLREKGQTYGEYLGLRARRLIAPLVPLVLIVGMIAAALSQISQSLAEDNGYNASRPLWFLAVYLVAVIVAPFFIDVHDRSPWIVPTVLFGGALAVDVYRFTVDPNPDDPGNYVWLSLLFVWLFCHQMGIIHARGILRRSPRWALAATTLAAVAALFAMVN